MSSEMQVYIVMGTHLREIHRCIVHMVKGSRDLDPVKVNVPTGLGWDAHADPCTLIEYDPNAVMWVIDPDKQGTLFIVIDPRQPLIPQLGKLADDLGKCLIEPVKIITFVDCARAEQNSRLKGWLDACIYYSDVVLLGNRAEASKSFVRDFQKHYERLCYPCLFIFLKGEGITSDSAEILTTGARRISQMFDIASSDIPEIPGIVIESSCDLDVQEAETDPFRQPVDDESAVHIPDPSEFIVQPESASGKNP